MQTTDHVKDPYGAPTIILDDEEGRLMHRKDIIGAIRHLRERIPGTSLTVAKHACDIYRDTVAKLQRMAQSALVLPEHQRIIGLTYAPSETIGSALYRAGIATTGPVQVRRKPSTTTGRHVLASVDIEGKASGPVNAVALPEPPSESAWSVYTARGGHADDGSAYTDAGITIPKITIKGHDHGAALDQLERALLQGVAEIRAYRNKVKP